MVVSDSEADLVEGEVEVDLVEGGVEEEVVLVWAVVVLVWENFGPKKSHGSIFQYASLVLLLLQEVHAQWVD